MKKTTKILLVLAAVVAMTIGAVSTVMAADYEYVTIGQWIEIDAAKNDYEAKDTDGNDIIRGWAVSEAGRWYFFDSGKMLFNTFVTYKEEIYYLDNTGCMAQGWIGFTKDTKVKTVDKYVKADYDNITLIDGFNGAFEVQTTDALGDALITNVFGDNSTYKTLYVYFKENGAMAQNEWECAWGQWFYMAGPYCVMNDFHVAIDNVKTVNNAVKMFSDNEDGIYGFDKNGVMLVGWAKYDFGTAANPGTGTDKDTPYEGITGAAGATSKIGYTYYDANGRQVNTKVDYADQATFFEGWEKIDGEWCYFVDEPTLGLMLLQNTVLYDINTEAAGNLNYNGQKGTFYLDANGYMVTGVQTFAGKAEIPTWYEENHAAGAKLKIRDAGTAYFYFNPAYGEMLDGVQGSYYYLDANTADDIDEIFLVENADITTNGVINVDESTAALIDPAGTFKYLDGQRLDRKANFFLVITEAAGKSFDGDNTVETFIFYFEAGVMQKNQAITFGETTIGIDANGNVLGKVGVVGTADDAAAGKEVTVAGYKYKYTANTELNLGVYKIMGIAK